PLTNSCLGYGFRAQSANTRFISMFLQGTNDATATPTISFSSPALSIRFDNGTGCGIQVGRFSNLGPNGSARFQFGSIEWVQDGGANTIQANSNFIPDFTQRWDLGTAALRWDEVFCRLLNEGSDRRLKSDIRDLDYGMQDIMALRPVSYSWKSAPEEGTHLGLIAQEVQAVMPEVVYDPSVDIRLDEEGNQLPADKDGMMGIYYTTLIPVLINGMQEQQATIEKLEAKVAQLTSGNPIDLPGNVNPLEDAKLYQNVPNPFNESTQIQYDLPAGVDQSQIFVFDMQGKLMTRISQEGAGRQVITIEAGSLGPGMYLYSLIIDGEEVDTKRMIITD
ncbi:MAG: tail fiber domain-containing protein, partial [Bacteroidota bacterium]